MLIVKKKILSLHYFLNIPCANLVQYKETKCFPKNITLSQAFEYMECISIVHTLCNTIHGMYLLVHTLCNTKKQNVSLKTLLSVRL